MAHTITITLPPALYDMAQTKLIDGGFFSDFDDLVKSGVRQMLLEWEITHQSPAPGVGTARYMFYLHKLRRAIAAAGGLFPNEDDDEVLERLRQTREQIYAEKYAAHFGY